MHLREARDKQKLEHFITEKEKTHPKASHLHFHATVRSMSAGTPKPKTETSKHSPRGG
jgi:hypothetical protein